MDPVGPAEGQVVATGAMLGYGEVYVTAGPIAASSIWLLPGAAPHLWAMRRKPNPAG